MMQTNKEFVYAAIIRAGLSSRLKHHLKVATDTLEDYRLYHREILDRASLTPNLRRIHDFTLLVGYLAQLEAYVTGVTADLLASFPEKMEWKEIPLKNILTAGSTHQLLRQTAKEKADSLWKGPVPNMAAATLERFTKKDKMEQSLLSELDKMKCGRNAFVHNGGKADQTYIDRVGCKRDMRVGDRIEPPRPEDVHRAVSRFVQEFHSQGPAKYLQWGRAMAFREMWKQTRLDAVIPFEQVWEYYPDDDMVMPKELPHRLSHGEQILYDFFLGIYNSDLPAGKAWLPDAMQYGGFPDAERKVINAWKEIPFFF